MSKTKFLTYIIIGLTITNITLLGFMMLHHKGGNPDHRPKKHIIKHLNFDDAQLKVYDELIEKHQIGSNAKNVQINSLKNQLYATLRGGNSVEQKDSLIQELSKMYIEMEELHYQHFEKIKTLCNEEQEEGFDNLIQELGGLFENRDKQTRPKRGKRH